MAKVANPLVQVAKRDQSLTVAALRQALARFPDDARVGVRASCCSHAHNILSIGPAGCDGPGTDDDGFGVVIFAND